MGKIILFSTLLIYSAAFSQKVTMQIDKSGNGIYKLRVLNATDSPIAIKCSIDLNKFTEKDTSKIAIGPWQNGNGRDYYYSLAKSISASKLSEPPRYYQLVILNPQTYLLTNICLTDYGEFESDSVFFLVEYTSELSSKEVAELSVRKKDVVKALTNKKLFLSITSKIPANKLVGSASE